MKSVVQAVAIAAAALAFADAASATVMPTVGAGSAVTTADAAANFENQNSLFDNPYVEDGLRFSRTNLSFNNNGCGFAGCAFNVGFSGFSGNYMYGAGLGGYFEIAAPIGKAFTGLEFVPGTGSQLLSRTAITWQAFLSGAPVGSGVVVADVTSILGFADLLAFDLLRFSTAFDGGPAEFGFLGSFNTPAFDSVRAQYSVAPTPLPAALPLFGTGFGVMGLIGWWRKRRGETVARRQA
jgi:hypothetical protein